MEMFELREAQLFRMLCGVFGREQVIPKARISFVCGGELPKLPTSRYPDYEEWVREFRCLFTVVNREDEPRLVVEFFSGFDGAVDPAEAAREQHLPTVLELRNIWYVKVSDEDIHDLLSPDVDFTILHLIEEQIGNELFAA